MKPMQFARANPKKLSDVMGSTQSPSAPQKKTMTAPSNRTPKPMQAMMNRGTNPLDSAAFRNTLRGGKTGDWYTRQGDKFEDGTYNPRTGKKSESRIVPAQKK